MHIAHFVQRVPPALGGSEAYFDRLAKFHRNFGDDVTTWSTTAIDLEAFWKKEKKHSQPEKSSLQRLYTPQIFPFRRYILKAASMIPIPKWQAVTLPCNPICPAMWRDVGQFDGPLDAVHATAFPYAFPIVCGLRLARRRSVPFVLTPFLHLGDPAEKKNKTKRQYTSRPLRWLLRSADRIFVQTKMELDAILEVGVKEEKIVLQRLGVNASECTGGNRTTWRQSLGIRDDEVVIGHLANNSVEKGTVDLLKAAMKLAATNRAFRIVLAGPDMENFRVFWNDYQVKENVIRLGYVTDQQKRDFFAGIDLFCLPSRSDSFGLVLLEAWANRKPVVVYNSGGPSEIVHNDVDGIVSNCNPDALQEGLQKLIFSRNHRESLGQSGWERIQREFQWPDKLALVRNTILGLTPLSPAFSAR